MVCSNIFSGYCPDPNSYFCQCASCTPTCSDPNPICAAVCDPRCVCRPGWIDNGYGTCIPLQFCQQGEWRRSYI